MTEAKTELLEKAYQRHLEQYQQVTPNSDWLQQHLADQNFAADLKLLWSCSDFVAAQAVMDPGLFQQLVESGDLWRSYSTSQYLDSLSSQLDDDCTEEQLNVQLRRFRRREMMRIIWRDFSRRASMLETTRDATLLAEACVKSALDCLHRLTVGEWGTPVDLSLIHI